MPGGDTSTGREALGAGGLVAGGTVGVGDDAADVAAGGPDDEHAAINTAMAAASAVLTR